MSLLEILHLFWHLLLVGIGAVSAGCLVSRYLQLKQAGKRSGLLFWWSLALTLGCVFVFWLLLWNFPQILGIPLQVVQFTQNLAQWILIPVFLFVLLIPTAELIVRSSLFGLLISTLMIVVFTLVLGGVLLLQSISLLEQNCPNCLNTLYSTGILAPIELLLAFIFLFLFLTMLGPHFWRPRAVGFTLIIFAFSTLAGLNLTRFWFGEVAGGWEKGFQPGPFSIWQMGREISYLFIFVGFWLATLPRVIKKIDHKKIVEIDHRRVLEKPY